MHEHVYLGLVCGGFVLPVTPAIVLPGLRTPLIDQQSIPTSTWHAEGVCRQRRSKGCLILIAPRRSPSL
jgi:hypothetical protein